MKGLLFSAEMARANAEGRKTETRRLAGLRAVNDALSDWTIFQEAIAEWKACSCRHNGPHSFAVKPRLATGNVFYQKETWQWNEPPSGAIFKADDVAGHIASPWKSPLHLAARDARFYARIVEVRCERLHEITEQGAKREGVQPTPGAGDRSGMNDASAVENYLALWDSINPKLPHSLNPWAWVYRYERVSSEEAFR